MNKKYYKCAICKGKFIKGQTDEEAERELKENYPGYSIEECELVCDDCYNIPYLKMLREDRKGGA